MRSRSLPFLAALALGACGPRGTEGSPPSATVPGAGRGPAADRVVELQAAHDADPAAGGATPAPAPADPEPPLALVLNIPAFRLDAYEGGERTRSLTVAVGTRRYPTPTGEYAIGEVTWNPSWQPPASDWARGDTPTPPGPANPMGRVKMHFYELYFIHGTPDRRSLGRAASHGCVRVANAEAMALARLVHRYGSPRVATALLDSLEAHPRATRRIRLDRPIPIRVVYEVAELDGGELRLHPDVYGIAVGDARERVLELVARAGYDPGEVDGARLDALLDRARTEHVAVPIDRLRLDAARRPDSSGGTPVPFDTAGCSLPGPAPEPDEEAGERS